MKDANSEIILIVMAILVDLDETTIVKAEQQLAKLKAYRHSRIYSSVTLSELVEVLKND